MGKPNIILIICDQMRGDCLGVNGNPIIQTPNLDDLATRGTNFSHGYSAVPSCLPARATLWSGQSQWHTGLLGMGGGQGPVPNDFPHTLAGELTQAGYRTHMVGKGHFHPLQSLMGFQSQELEESGRALNQGFVDEYRLWFAEHAPAGMTPEDHGVNANSLLARPWHTDEYLHPSAWTTSRAIEFLKRRDRQQPFFLNLSFARPHSPYVPPQPFFDMYYSDETPPPYVGDWAEMHDNPDDAMSTTAWHGRKTAKQIHRTRAGYYGEVSFIDTQIGRLINWYSRYQPQDMRNTWIVFTSDHGDMQGDHHLWRKTYAYEGSTHIPFFVVPPLNQERPACRTVDEVVELRDIMPTLLEAAGVPIPPTVDGQSLLPLMDAPATEWRPYIHGEHCTCYSPEQEMQFVTDGRRKFVWLPRLGVEQFFDLEADPGECRNLIADGDRQAEVATWRGYLVRELEARDCGWVTDGQLTPAAGDLISPYRDVRWQGEEAASRA